MRLYTMQTPGGTCLKFDYNGYEVSVAFESPSCTLQQTKSDVRVYKGNDDVTHRFEEFNLYYVSLDDLVKVKEHIDYITVFDLGKGEAQKKRWDATDWAEDKWHNELQEKYPGLEEAYWDGFTAGRV